MPQGYGFRCSKCGHTAIDDTTVNGWTCPECKAGAMHHDINVRGGRLDPFAWPGGYTVIYVDEDGDVYCAKCAAKRRDEGDIRGNLSHATYDEGAPLACDECGEEMESSYGEGT